MQIQFEIYGMKITGIGAELKKSTFCVFIVIANKPNQRYNLKLFEY